MSIILAEKPFNSIQAEGNTIGKISTFIRFLGCNLKCEWCDSKHTWKKTEDCVEYEGIIDLSQNIRHLVSNAGNVIFTGGEPLLFQKTITDIADDINSIFTDKCSFEIETNLIPEIKDDTFIDWIFRNRNSIQFNISPKLQFKEYYNKVLDNIKILNKYRVNYILKFVLEKDGSNKDDILDFINHVIYLQSLSRDQIFIMPECISREEHINSFENTLDFCKEYNFNFSPRVHILLWDNKKRV